METALPQAHVRPKAAARRRVFMPGRWLLYAALIAGAAIMTFPFYWMLATSVKTLVEALLFPPSLWPREWHPENYLQAWRLAPFARYFVNTILIAVAQVVALLVTSTLAAYAFARVSFAGKNLVFVLFLATLMVPFEVTLVPNFIVLKNLGWYNTYLALIVPFSTSVFAIFLLRQFFLSIPQELYDAAQIDGCSRFGFLWRIAVPLARPGLITVALLAFLGAWNSFLWPLIMTGSEQMRVLQVGLSNFQSEAGTQYHLWMAAATFTILPIVVLYLIAQRYFVEAVAGSGIKG